ncbi:adenine phosphoribosyltransferase [Mycoplasma sp. Pen4]|uniref:adenine phosphoribosyltransferase n=1 Tax=Mycoplasma sp. Pen4 TaxID=640330 RepID=UPI0016549070|nr:adenine phosphoribosyltransferase [Mycoplasma sp. Pen4]QNM93501.1 adenine phosphoribosyltransferase [Mycoplasma sp. Pen4]
MNLKDYIIDVPNFPKPGITFKDISPLLNQPEAFKHVIDLMSEHAKDANMVVAPDARGFIFGTPVAYATHKPFIMVRKPGKLPGQTVKQNYDLEYGTNSLEIQVNVLKPGTNAVIVDDVLATGGTVKAIIDLLNSQGIKVTKLIVLYELKALNGREKLPKDIEIISLISE